MTEITLTPKEISPLLDVCTAADVAVMLHGDPGEGKTAFVTKWAEDRGYKVMTLVGSQMEPTDIGGYPIPLPDFGGVKFVTPEWAQRIHRDAEEGIKWLIFLDEVTCTPPGVQAALFKLICERQINGEALPASTRIVAAGNKENVSTSRPLAEPMQTRFAHFNWVGYSLADVQVMRAEGWPTPPAPQMVDHTLANQTIWDAFIAAQAKLHPKWENDLASGGEVASAGRGYPCNRSWSYLSKALSYLGGNPMDVDTSLLVNLAVSLVGVGPGTEFAMAVRDMALPDPEEWLSDPENVEALNRDDANLAMLAGVAAAVAADCTSARWNAGMRVLFRIADQKSDSLVVPALIALRSTYDTAQPKPKPSRQNMRDLGERFSDTFKRVGILSEHAA